MFPVKPKDLVLMSVIAQLPSSASTIPQSADKPVLRLVAATTSTEHERKPAGSGGRQRMTLNISGFILEEDGEGGVLLTQVTDVRRGQRNRREKSQTESCRDSCLVSAAGCRPKSSTW